MSKIRIAAWVCVFVLLAPFAGAHPGHGTTEPAGLLHFVFEPDHAFFALIAIALSIATIVGRRRGAWGVKS